MPGAGAWPRVPLPRTTGGAVGLATVLTVALGALNALGGPGVELSVFFLAPIFLVTWVAGRPWGVAFALIAAWTDTVGDLARAVAFAHPFLPVWDFAAKAGVYAISVVVLAELHDALARERELARTDMLTGVANRRAFFEQATQEIERSLRYNRPFSVAVLDVDDFKQVNDRFGHGAGDVVLRAVAGAIHLNTRALDLVARLGGDEFGVILPETTAEASEAMVGKLRAVLQQAMREQAHPVTVSIGLVTFDAPPATADELVRRADALMYQVKRTGKNQLKHEVVTW